MSDNEPDHVLVPDADDPSGMRRPYGGRGFDFGDLAPTWAEQFRRWFAETVASGLVAEPNAMVLATASDDAVPSARTVLLKGYDERGMVFYSNHSSRKGKDIAANPLAAAVFSWVPIGRQVIVHGVVESLPADHAAAYFQSRPRGSQIGAWASAQSEVIESRAALDAAFGAAASRFDSDEPVPMPWYWGGYVIIPESVEFWAGRPNRLHDRLRYRRFGEGWIAERLAP